MASGRSERLQFAAQFNWAQCLFVMYPLREVAGSILRRPKWGGTTKIDRIASRIWERCRHAALAIVSLISGGTKVATLPTSQRAFLAPYNLPPRELICFVTRLLGHGCCTPPELAILRTVFTLRSRFVDGRKAPRSRHTTEE